MYVGCAYSGHTLQIHLGVCSENCWAVNSVVSGTWCRSSSQAFFSTHSMSALSISFNVLGDGCEFESTVQVHSHLQSVRSVSMP